MTKPPIPTENSKTKGQHTQTPPKTSITQRLRTDLGRSVGVTSNPTGVVKPVYGIPTFPLTAKAVLSTYSQKIIRSYKFRMFVKYKNSTVIISAYSDVAIREITTTQ